jgi:hypothetical protein
VGRRTTVHGAPRWPPGPYAGGMSTVPAPEPRDPSGPRDPMPALVFDDPLTRPSSDDTDRGWGERAEGDSAADLRRFLDEKPPHHI